MLAEESGVKVFTFRDLDNVQQMDIIDFFLAHEKMSADLKPSVLSHWGSRKYMHVFCAFLGNKPVGISVHTNVSGTLRQDFKAYIITPKSFVKMSNKTVGRLMYDTILSYCHEHSLSPGKLVGQSKSGIRAVQRLNLKKEDLPRQGKKKLTLRPKLP